MAIRIKLGDCFEIPLPNGRFAYCQHINRNPTLGFLVQVFSHLSHEPVQSINDLLGQPLMFPPVFVGLQATARDERWKRIGNLPVTSFVFPHFRQTVGTKPGTYSSWSVWDGEHTRHIGKLPKELRKLELECVWGDQALEERIMAGTYRGDKMH
jgi:hypothetical protein